MSLEDISEKLNSINDNSIPAWALLLMESMKVIIDELKVVKDLAARVNVLECFKAVSEKVTSNLENENSRQLKLITNLELKVDDEEQRSRNTCLLIHGIQENYRENTDELALKVINNDIGLSNIQQCEIRDPTVQSSTKKEIYVPVQLTPPKLQSDLLVKFTNFNTRLRVYKNKKELKG